MPTLILSPRYTPDSIALRNAALGVGWSVERLPTWRVDAGASYTDPVIHGEPLFAEAVAEALGVALLAPPPDWLCTLPSELLGRRVRAMKLSEARRLNAPAFVKPVFHKLFAARVYEPAQLPSPEALGGDAGVLVADPVRFVLELRCFVGPPEIAAMSPYAEAEPGRLLDETGCVRDRDLLRAARAFAEGVLARSDLVPPACALDVGLLDTGTWAVIEANAAWAAGLYQCEPAAVLPVLERSMLLSGRVGTHERRWVHAMPG